MSTLLAQDTDRSTNQLGVPPPSALELADADRAVGWVLGNRIGFRGFGAEEEAMHAAWVAYRTLMRRLARRMGTRPLPIDVEPLTIHRRGESKVIVAGDRDVATLVRFAPDSASHNESFGFEISVPGPIDDLTMRSKAYVIYRTLRKSGIRWAMWRPRRDPPAPRIRLVTPELSAVETPSALEFLSKLILGSIAVLLAVALVAAAPRTVSVPLGLVLVSGLIASGTIVLTDRRKGRRRAESPSAEGLRLDGITAHNR